MKGFIRFTWSLLFFGLVAFPAQAAFTSFCIFGDGVSTTTNNPFAGQYYYGLRRSNGRVWVEVLAQELGLTNNYWYSTNVSYPIYYTNLSASSTNWSYSSNNWSYYGQDSTNMFKHVTNFPAPSNANTALFVIWVIHADFVWNANNFGTNIALWTNSLNQSLIYDFGAITNLYSKGVRTLIMPNAADITKVPYYVGYAPANRAFIRQRTIDFNTAFTAMLSNAMISLPNLKIYEPDIFSLLDNVVAHATDYGLTNALDNRGLSVDALGDTSLTNKSLNGPGTNYIFWDNMDPTAKFHAVIADVVQQLVSPSQISQLTLLDDSNQLDMASLPIGLNGFVQGSTNLMLTNWTAQASFNSLNATQSVFVPDSDSPQYFYRLYFPYAWSWP